MTKKLCEICGERPATVPDRNRMPGRLINRICSECHSMRLRDDFARIFAFRAKREAELKARAGLTK